MDYFEETLGKLPGRQDEHEWLRETLAFASEREKAILAAGLERTPPKNAAEAVNLMLNLESYEVCVGANYYEALGQYFLDYEVGSLIPTEARQYIDLESLGRKYEDNHPGLFIGSDYVVYPADQTTAFYDGGELPSVGGDWSLRLKLASPTHPEGVWVKLPDYQEMTEERPGEIRMALNALGLKDLEWCELLDARCCLPGITGLTEYEDLSDLIYDGQNLGIILDEQGQGQEHFMEKYLAALELEGCDSLKFALDIGQNIKCYDMVLVSGLEQTGKDAILKRMGAEEREMFSGCVDFAGYARAMLEQSDSVPVLDGKAYIRRNGQTFHAEYSETTGSAQDRGMQMM